MVFVRRAPTHALGILSVPRQHEAGLLARTIPGVHTGPVAYPRSVNISPAIEDDLLERARKLARRRGLLALLVAVGTLAAGGALLAWANHPFVPLSDDARADRVLVLKAQRELLLLDGETALRRYPISLGGAPRGPKQREGDERTPEGLYRLDARNPRSAFHLSLHVSYPDAEDRRRAAREGVDAGGMIMVHGLPNRLPFLGRLHRLVDWTDGCIAVTNPEIEQIWRAVEDGTPIEIRP